MTVTEYDNEEEFDDAFERLEELQFEHLHLKEAVEEAEKGLKYAEEELRNFEEDNKESLL